MANERKEIIKMLYDVGTVGMTMAFSIFIGLGIGYYLDHKVFGGRTTPWLTFIFMAFGVVAAFKNLYTTAKRKDL